LKKTTNKNPIFFKKKYSDPKLDGPTQLNLKKIPFAWAFIPDPRSLANLTFFVF